MTLGPPIRTPPPPKPEWWPDPDNPKFLLNAKGQRQTNNHQPIVKPPK